MPRSQKDRFRQASAAQARRDQQAAEATRQRDNSFSPGVARMPDLDQAMIAMVEGIKRMQSAGEQGGRTAADMVQRLSRQKPPTIRTDKPLTTSLPRRKLKCPEHQVAMSFSPGSALWHCTVPDCDYTAYNVADPLGGEPRKPQVINEDLDVIVAKTEHGERTYLRAKKLGLLIDITEQTSDIRVEEDNVHRTRYTVLTTDLDVKTVDYR